MSTGKDDNAVCYLRCGYTSKPTVVHVFVGWIADAKLVEAGSAPKLPIYPDC